MKTVHTKSIFYKLQTIQPPEIFSEFGDVMLNWHDQLTNDELSASCRDEFESASKIHRAPHSLMYANCEPEKSWIEKKGVDEKKKEKDKDRNEEKGTKTKRGVMFMCTKTRVRTMMSTKRVDHLAFSVDNCAQGWLEKTVHHSWN